MSVFWTKLFKYLGEVDIYIEDTRHRPRRQNILVEITERVYIRLALKEKSLLSLILT